MIESPYSKGDEGAPCRVIVLIEKPDAPNNYGQIVFNKDQFRKVMSVVEGQMQPFPGGSFQVTTTHNFPLPELKGFYTDEEIDAVIKEGHEEAASE